MIKVDIINEVSQGRRHHQGEGRGGRRGGPRGDEGLHDARGADRAARLRRLPGEAAQAGHRPQPADGQGSEDPARPHDPLQAGQGPPEPHASRASHHAQRVDVDHDSRPADFPVACDHRGPHRVPHRAARRPFKQDLEAVVLPQPRQGARAGPSTRYFPAPAPSRRRRASAIRVPRGRLRLPCRARPGSAATPSADTPWCAGTATRCSKKPS